MSQAIVSPEEVRRFATQLRAFNGNLKENMGHLEAQFRRLGETWRDRKHARFAEEFEHTNRVLRQFIKTSEAHIPELLRSAQKADDYLQ